MGIDNFISIGENIHCTRSVKSGGIRTTELPGGGEGVTFKYLGNDKVMPVPANWQEISPSYAEGKVRHIALAIHHARKGSGEEKAIGEEYLRWAIDRQVENGADYLDINVDEFSTNLAERIDIMKCNEIFIFMNHFAGNIFVTDLTKNAILSTHSNLLFSNISF